MSIVEVNGSSEMPTIIIGRDTNIRDALEARRVSTGPMALAGKWTIMVIDYRWKFLVGLQFSNFSQTPKKIWRYGCEQLDACTH